ncbi:MAG: antitoxin [Bifidobacteriaceae bacterium]|nr:antitoxin [Bifidobacteriaceae bacterium]
MPDLLIRGLSQEAIACVDQAASAAGLSRNEYLRRGFETAGAARKGDKVTVADLTRSSAAVTDLLDDGFMSEAWQ